MFCFKKKKIQKYLDQKADNMDAFDLLLSDYISGEMTQKLAMHGMKHVDIFVDWTKDFKCIGIQGRYKEYFVDVQIYPTEYNISIDVVEPDDDVLYPLLSCEQIYDALAKTFEEKDQGG